MALTDRTATSDLLGETPGPPSRLPQRRWLYPTIVIAALVLAPVLGLLWFALRGSGDLWPHLIEFVIPTATKNTAVLLVGVGVAVTVIGVGTAWLVATFRFPGRRIFEWALLLPLAVPTYIVAYAYLDVMHPTGPVQTLIRDLFGIASPRDFRLPDIRSMWGCVALFSLVLFPYVYLPVRALFVLQSASYVEAARMLGSGPLKAFFRIAVPLIRPALVIGLTLALLETLNDVGAAQFLGVRTMTVSIYTVWSTNNSVEGAAQIALAMLVVILALLIWERSARRRQRYVGGGQRTAPPPPVRLNGWRAVAAVAACAMPILLGFAAPVSYLVHSAMIRIGEFGWPPQLLSWIGNTVTLASIATVVAVALGLFLAYAARVLQSPTGRIAIRLSTIGYALPGTVLALGVLTPIGSLDNAINRFMADTFGASVGLVLLGSGAAVTFAYVLRFLPIAVGNAEAGLAKVSPSLDMAARSLGAGPAEAARRIHLPIIRPALIAGALLVFVDCMKELPATLMLRPLNFETLATQLYGEAVRGTYEVAAVSALAIVLVGLAPVILLARTMERRPRVSSRTVGSVQP